jgi:hypothetical protein
MCVHPNGLPFPNDDVCCSDSPTHLCKDSGSQRGLGVTTAVVSIVTIVSGMVFVCQWCVVVPVCAGISGLGLGHVRVTTATSLVFLV